MEGAGRVFVTYGLAAFGALLIWVLSGLYQNRPLLLEYLFSCKFFKPDK